jgi:hypothetical protein
MEYRLKLMENGIDFLKSGIETYFDKDTPDPRAHKYAILHMFSGVLLLLKERLARVHPSLVFENPAQCGTSGAKTTSYHKTIKRLKENGVKIAPAKRRVLDEIRALRNDIEHYEVNLDLARTKEVIAELAAFVYFFCVDELKFHIDDGLSEVSRARFYELKEIGDRLYEEALASANADAQADDAFFQTIEMKYIAIIPGELLTFVATERGLTPDAVERVECPTCREMTLVLLEVGVCINPNCRATQRLGECHYCHGIAFNGAYHCERCQTG